MQRIIPYLTLLVVALLSQFYIFDNLAISIYLNPLVYVVFVLLLPIETKPSVVLAASLALGMMVDWMMGCAGVNTIATLLVGFVRLYILRAVCSRDEIRDGGIPSQRLFGRDDFLSYVAILVVVHHLCFFVLEALSFYSLLQLFARTLFSSAVTIGYVVIVSQLFTRKSVH